jgi:hypothetical protein
MRFTFSGCRANVLRNPATDIVQFGKLHLEPLKLARQPVSFSVNVRKLFLDALYLLT